MNPSINKQTNIKTTSYKNIYDNKVVDPSKKRYCAIFELTVTSTLAKNRQNNFLVLLGFCVFGLYDLKFDLKVKFDLNRPT